MSFLDLDIEVNETLSLKIDKAYSIIWIKIGTKHELHYSLKALSTFCETMPYIKSIIQENEIKYAVLISANKQVWNMGGDLELFSNCVKNKDIDTLKDYANKCINVVHYFNSSLESNVIVISIVQGNAFGGGFECALSGDYIIAEEHAKFSFPEVVFGTFPGMGAYSFITRKLGYNKAAEMMNSNQKWTASELNKTGLLDFVTDTGNGISYFYELLTNDQFESRSAHKKICTTVPLSELHGIIELWIDSVMSLSESQLRVIEKIVSAQKQITNQVVT
jgi:DSF synthase